MIQNDIFQEIQTITLKLIEFGLSIKQNFPKNYSNKVSWEAEADLSNVLRNLEYIEKYKLVDNSNNYNIKLLDGGLLQLQYEFSKTGHKLCGHRLAYFPCPILERFDDVPEEYEKNYFGKSEFHDLFEPNAVVFPVRFDYSNDSRKFVDIEHPFTHAHFGEYESCRIPISSPVSPNEFVNFILRNFYRFALVKHKRNLHFKLENKFDITITSNEKKLIYFSCR